MELIESLRFALRKRIVLDAEIVPQTHYQMEGRNAPDNVDLYIRETIIQSDVTEIMQSALRYQFICEYDAFVNRSELPDVTGQLYRIAGMFRSEFPAGTNIVLDGVSNVQCFVSSPIVTNAISQESDLFELPIILNVEIIADRSAVYNGN
jgi:hypothetical protein